MRRILLLVIACFWAAEAVSQGFIGPSPNATATMRQANIGVNHYTGSLNTSIPLATLSGKELNVSAALSYNGSGHRVQDIASSEGLGWSLVAGGVITRIVRGIPDDLQNGFCTPNKSDTEPDLFIFSFMGRTGKFVLDSNGVPALFPFQDLKIIPGICNSNNIWQIIDENGTIYRFGTSILARETTTYRPVTNSEPSKSYISTWYLEKVISANGTDEISFTYTSSTIQYVNYFFRKDELCATDTGLKDESINLSIGVKYVSTILTSGGSMQFTWNNYREDVQGAKSLSEIRVVNSQGEQVQKLRFNYSYFGACSTALCKRLKLESISDLSPIPIYSFVYNTNENLPSRDSKSFDAWGFYNSYTGSSWLPTDPILGLSGASREPHVTKMQANLLTRIVERGGAYQHFYYEPHEGIKDLQGNSYLIGGVRINSVQSNDGNGNVVTKYYKYLLTDQTSSGIVFRRPIFSYYLKNGNTVVAARRYSHAYGELLDVNGVNVGYSRVEESETGKGKTVYSFTNYDTYPDEVLSGSADYNAPPFSSITSRFWERGNLTNLSVYSQEGNILSSSIYEYHFSHPDKKVVLGSKSASISFNGCGLGSGSSSISSSYKIVSKPFTLKKISSELYDLDDPANLRKVTSVTEYEYDPITYQAIRTTAYNLMSSTEKYVTVSKYVTNSAYTYTSSTNCLNNYNQCAAACSPTDTNCLQNCSLIYNNCITQGTSDSRTVSIQALRAKHVQNALIEQQTWFEQGSEKYLISSSLNLYKTAGANSQWVVPASVWSGEKLTGSFAGSSINSSGQFVQPASYKLAHTYQTYDNTTGRLNQETAGDGIVTNYTWIHNGTLPGTVTLNPGGAQFTSTYVYKPLVGVVKETDTNGRSFSTEFDFQGRKRLVKDHDNNIRSRTRYHYKNESPGVKIVANPSQIVRGQTVNFTLGDIANPTGGTPEYIWDMGNGTVYQDNRQQTSQVYSQSGMYKIQVVMKTNEYEPYTATYDLLVNNPLQASICANGPQTIDICGQTPPDYGLCTTTNNQPYSPTELKVSVPSNSGCLGTYTYVWHYKLYSSSSWISMASDTDAVVFPYHVGGEAEYQIRCVVTDSCGNSVTATSFMSYIKSNPNCTGGIAVQQQSSDNN
jgi:hypothetical protein